MNRALSSRGLLLLTCYLAQQALLCRGHGFLISPLSRARVLNYGEYESSAGNGLGASPYRKNPDGSLLNDQADVCGDPHQDVGDMSLRSRVTAIQATYTEGTNITVVFRARVNHGGWLGIRLCPTARIDPTQACFDAYTLVNADTGYTRWWIQTGAYLVQTDYSTKWRLPAGVTCDAGCVLQLIYRTANSCVDSCAEAECGAAYAARNNLITQQFNLPSCGRTEVFKDCADVRIVASSGSSRPPSPLPPSPSPPSSRSPSPRPPQLRPSPPAPRSPPPSPTPSNSTRLPPPRPRPPSPSPPSPSSSDTCGQSAADFCRGRAQGRYGDKCTSCVNFYWCYGTGSVYTSCAPGTAIDPTGTMSSCTWPSSVNCQ